MGIDKCIQTKIDTRRDEGEKAGTSWNNSQTSFPLRKCCDSFSESLLPFEMWLCFSACVILALSQSKFISGLDLSANSTQLNSTNQVASGSNAQALSNDELERQSELNRLIASDQQLRNSEGGSFNAEASISGDSSLSTADQEEDSIPPLQPGEIYPYLPGANDTYPRTRRTFRKLFDWIKGYFSDGDDDTYYSPYYDDEGHEYYLPPRHHPQPLPPIVPYPYPPPPIVPTYIHPSNHYLHPSSHPSPHGYPHYVTHFGRPSYAERDDKVGASKKYEQKAVYQAQRPRYLGIETSPYENGGASSKYEKIATTAQLQKPRLTTEDSSENYNLPQSSYQGNSYSYHEKPIAGQPYESEETVSELDSEGYYGTLMDPRKIFSSKPDSSQGFKPYTRRDDHKSFPSRVRVSRNPSTEATKEYLDDLPENSYPSISLKEIRDKFRTKPEQNRRQYDSKAEPLSPLDTSYTRIVPLQEGTRRYPDRIRKRPQNRPLSDAQISQSNDESNSTDESNDDVQDMYQTSNGIRYPVYPNPPQRRPANRKRPTRMPPKDDVEEQSSNNIYFPPKPIRPPVNASDSDHLESGEFPNAPIPPSIPFVPPTAAFLLGLPPPARRNRTEDDHTPAPDTSSSHLVDRFEEPPAVGPSAIRAGERENPFLQPHPPPMPSGHLGAAIDHEQSGGVSGSRPSSTSPTPVYKPPPVMKRPQVRRVRIPNPEKQECGMKNSSDPGWLAAIIYEDEKGEEFLGCTGALISDRHVLVAAHCLDPSMIEPHGQVSQVLLGHSTNSSSVCPTCYSEAEESDVVSVGIRDMFIYPDYGMFDLPKSATDDIAIIRLSNPIRLSDKIHPICLPLESRFLATALNDSFAGSQAQVVGWGRMRFPEMKHKILNQPKEMLDRLQSPVPPKKDQPVETDVEILHPIECVRASALRDYLNPDAHICVGPEKGHHEECIQDSGSPLVVSTKGATSQTFLLGVESLGFVHCIQGPRLYMNIANYLPWIIAQIHHP